MKHIICFGNPSDGFEFVGPFAGADAATEYADRHLARGGDWWTILLQEPAKSEETA